MGCASTSLCRVLVFCVDYRLLSSSSSSSSLLLLSSSAVILRPWRLTSVFFYRTCVNFSINSPIISVFTFSITSSFLRHFLWHLRLILKKSALPSLSTFCHIWLYLFYQLFCHFLLRPNCLYQLTYLFLSASSVPSHPSVPSALPLDWSLGVALWRLVSWCCRNAALLCGLWGAWPSRFGGCFAAVCASDRLWLPRFGALASTLAAGAVLGTLCTAWHWQNLEIEPFMSHGICNILDMVSVFFELKPSRLQGLCSIMELRTSHLAQYIQYCEVSAFQFSSRHWPWIAETT